MLPAPSRGLVQAFGCVVGLVCGAGLCLAPSGCRLTALLSEECEAPEPPAYESGSPIAKALRYLDFTQVKTDQSNGNTIDYAGDWPQCYGFDRQGPFVREVNPFGPALIHHALCLITEANRDALGLTDADIVLARAMRTRAIEFMLRFRMDEGWPDAGTIGYWLPRRRERSLGDVLLAMLVEDHYRGPRFMGHLFPVNVSFFPEDFAIPPDAETTAVVYAALLDHGMLDGGPAVTVAFERFFADWRDLGQVPRRDKQAWIPPSSGAYLTWLAYRNDPAQPGLNDVDVLVNANVLYTLGRYGRLETEGAAEAVSLINGAILSGVHVSHPGQLSQYYSDTIIAHYYVTRAYREGGVSGLSPAVDALVEDLLATVETDSAGRSFWNRGDPVMNTAFAALALIAAQRAPDLVPSAIEYLVWEQGTASGAWEPGAITVGRLDNGAKPIWISQASTTGIVLEALCRYRLPASRG